MNFSKYVRLIVIAAVLGMVGQLFFGEVISGAFIAAGFAAGLFLPDNGRISLLAQVGLVLFAAFAGDLWFEYIGGSGIVVAATLAVGLLATVDHRSSKPTQSPDEDN